MNHVEQESQGTGLGDVFGILEKTPSDRVRSLTFQLGESPEEIILHALCLILLQRETEALNKLQSLGDNSLANYLAEKWHTSGVQLDDFGAHCCQFQAQSGESLSALAKIFKVLSEQRLCGSPRRDEAYKRALCSDCFKASDCNDLKYIQLREEAKAVCGPQIAEWLSSINLGLEFPSEPKRIRDEGNATLKVSESQDANIQPCPLQGSPSMASYPTHLEISIPPTDSFQENKDPPGTLKTPEINPSILPVSENVSRSTDSPRSLQVQAEKDSKMDGTKAAISSDLKTLTLNETPTQPYNPSVRPKLAQSVTNISIPKMPTPQQISENKVTEEEEKDTFYAFVILHAPEDADMAVSLKEEIETIIGNEGATYSEDFADLGKGSLQCVEDAINNSAFTFLLLTHNFNSKFLEMKTNIALINSINNKHKFNTVIPLLPRENCMPRQCIPTVLQTLVPLDAKQKMDKKLQKGLSSARIERQRKIWMKEQTLRQKHLESQENQKLCLCMEPKSLLSPSVPQGQEDGDGRAWCLSHPNIHIENANYIMIGNDSSMTVDVCRSADKDGSVHTEEEH